jgi:hypothetical protein
MVLELIALLIIVSVIMWFFDFMNALKLIWGIILLLGLIVGFGFIAGFGIKFAFMCFGG